MPVARLTVKSNPQAVTFLNQSVAQEDQPGFLPPALTQQTRFGIRRASVRLVVLALPSEIHTGVARIVIRKRQRSSLEPEAPGLTGTSIKVPSTLR